MKSSSARRTGMGWSLLLAVCLGAIFCQRGQGQTLRSHSLLNPTNLVAWCIVPFDAVGRSPTERARMLQRLGIGRMAYDWRAEHIPTFDEEIAAMRRHGIEITAWWIMPQWGPGGLDTASQAVLDACERNGLKTQFWALIGEPLPESKDTTAKVLAGAQQLRPFIEAADRIGCQVALYNHGGWFGEPANQVAILKELGLPNAGIVYNFHHGHAHIEQFREVFETMRPYLLALNLNGMVRGGDTVGQKILNLSAGDQELEMLRVVVESDWRGPIGILDHRDETDSEVTLSENLRGLKWLIRELEGPGTGGERPFQVPPTSVPPSRTSQGAPETDMSQQDVQSWKELPFWSLESAAERAALPEFQVIPAASPSERTPSEGREASGAHRNWHRSHADAHSTRYSSLNQIHRGNVQALRPTWVYRSGDGVGNIQCNPIMVDRTLYAPTVGDYLVALDATSGVERWRFKPGGRPAHRGLVYWPGQGGQKPRLLFNAGEFLHALDPSTGAPLEEFGDGGKVETGPVVVAGAIFQHVLVIPGFHRDVYGYDVRTGKKLWHFNTIPEAAETHAETWDKPGTGANCWGGLALDEHRGIAYIATGSPKPNFIGIHHRGDNLYANCVLALNALTGEYLWHFQEIRHDIWDLDIPAPPNLVTVEQGGIRVDAVAQVTKLGNTLLLDRLTGKPLFDVPLRRAPVSSLPGERTAPYQPDIQRPQPFARQVFRMEDITNRTQDARAYVTAQVARSNFGWFVPFEDGVPTVLYGIHGGAEWTGAAVDPNQGILYVSSNEVPWIITVHRTDDIPRSPGTALSRGEQVYREHCASCHGMDREGLGVSPPLQGLRHRMTDRAVNALLASGRNLMPVAPEMSEEDRKSLLDHLFLRDRAKRGADDTVPPVFTHDGYRKLLDPDGYPGTRPPWGTLNAIDLNTGDLLWQVPLGEYPELTAQGFPRTGTENFGGPIATAGGLVFCAGTRDERLRAFDTATGEELWSWKLPWGGYAPPATYEVDGIQYVVIAATGGGKLGGPMGDAYVAFRLDATRK